MKFSAKPLLSGSANLVASEITHLLEAPLDEIERALLIATKDEELNQFKDLYQAAWWGVGSAHRAKWKEYVNAGKQIKFRGGQC